MSKILDIAKKMGGEVIGDQKKTISKKCAAKCSLCGVDRVISVGALYKQHKRGHTKYVCSACAGKAGWNDENKAKASVKSTENWKDPAYAGTVDGKMMANSIRKAVNDAFFPDGDVYNNGD